MQIVEIETYRLQVPLRTPFKTALRTVNVVEDLVVRVVLDNGLVGFGEAAPTLVITGDSLHSMHAVIHQVYKPLLVGRSIHDFNDLLRVVQQAVVANRSAKAALEIALYDVRARAFGVPLYQLLGGGLSELQTDITISVNPVAQMVEDAQSAVARGYRQLKIKLGTDGQLDVARVKAIAAAVPSEVKLRLDANQGWTAKQCIQLLQQLEAAGVMAELIEQPVAASDLAGLHAVTSAITTPVLADESAFDLTQVLSILQGRSADMINIKLMKTAGISQALQIAQLASAFRVPCMMGSMLESSISVAAAAHVASACGITVLDLDGPELCQFDPVAAVAANIKAVTQFSGPHIRLNQTPGLGIDAVQGLQLWPWQP